MSYYGYPYYGNPYYGNPYYNYGYGNPYSYPYLTNNYKLDGLLNEYDELNALSVKNNAITAQNLADDCQDCQFTNRDIHVVLQNKNSELKNHIINKNVEISELHKKLDEHNIPRFEMDSSMNKVHMVHPVAEPSINEKRFGYPHSYPHSYPHPYPHPYPRPRPPHYPYPYYYPWNYHRDMSGEVMPPHFIGPPHTVFKNISSVPKPLPAE